MARPVQAIITLIVFFFKRYVVMAPPNSLFYLKASSRVRPPVEPRKEHDMDKNQRQVGTPKAHGNDINLFMPYREEYTVCSFFFLSFFLFLAFWKE